MTSWLHEQVRMAEVLPRKESAGQVILPWPFAPLDLGEPSQQGTPVARIHADPAQRQRGEIAPATARNPRQCLGRLSTQSFQREVLVFPREIREGVIVD